MDYIKLTLVGIITIVIAYLTICTFSPEKVAASKTLVIHEPKEMVLAKISDLSTWTDWHPYLDSAKQESIKSTKNELTWESVNGVRAKVKITHAADSNRMSFSTSFEKNGEWKTYSGEFLIEGGQRETKLSWIYVGEPFKFLKRPANYVIKEVVGKTMERGLYRLNKSIRDNK